MKKGRKKGVIFSYNRKNLNGMISYGNQPLLPFSYIDVLSYNPNKLREGLNVSFALKTINQGQKIAVRIAVLSEKSAIFDIKKHVYQNWEEMERLIDEPYPTREIISSSELSLDIVKSTTTEVNIFDTRLVGLGLFGDKLKLVTLTEDGRYNFLDQAQKYHNILYPSFFKEAALEIAIEEFEDLINSSLASESDYQKFFERNPDFILNENYKKAHPHIILEQDDNRKLIPDFVLEPVRQGAFCDLLELKLPTPNIYVMKENRERYSAAVSGAAAQLRNYSQYFNDRYNREKFEAVYPHLKLYRPKLFLIIGRQKDENPMIMRDVEADFPHITISNYDDLLARMIWKKEKLEEMNKLFR